VTTGFDSSHASEMRAALQLWAFAIGAMASRIFQVRSLSTRGKSTDIGGIDLIPANNVLQIQNTGQAIKFHIDAAQLAQLQNAPGFVPVIINIQPINNLREFLGLNELPTVKSR